MEEAKLYYKMAVCAMNDKDFRVAASYFLKLVNLMSDVPELHYNLASALFELKEYSESQKHYAVAAKLAPDAVTYFNLGVVHEQLQDPSAARAAYEQAISFDPNYFEAHYNLGLLAIDNENQKLAKKHLEVAKSLKPGDVVVGFQLARISGENIPKPPPEHVTTLFDKYAGHFESHLQGGLNYQVPELMLEYLQESGVDLSGLVLDLGCGTGLIGKALNTAMKPKKLIGVDLSSKMIEVAAQKNIYQELVRADLLVYLENCKERFEVICAADVLNYFGDLSKVFSLVGQCLKPSGVFVFSLETHHQLDDNYQLSIHGRYKHQTTYVQSLVESLKMQCESKCVHGRVQDGRPVPMCLYKITG